MTRAPGRPTTGPNGEPRDQVIYLRVSDSEHHAWATAAAAAGVSLAEWVRVACAERAATTRRKGER